MLTRGAPQATIATVRTDMNTRAIISGMATYLPKLPAKQAGDSAGYVSPRYCYSVWLRHLVMAHQGGFSTDPEVVAELGPGDSLGLGLAALLTGATKYYAFDIVAHTNVERNLRLFDELVPLFRAREAIPGELEFPKVHPYLGRYEFPHEILTDSRLARALAPDRVAAIRRALEHMGQTAGGGIEVRYVAYRYDANVMREQSVDMIFSQAVMEHVDDAAETYAALHRWLKPGGFMSHVIDFKSHGTAKTWNGHWAYSDLEWRVIRGRRKFLISNRLPVSAHINLLREANFDVTRCLRTTHRSGIARRDLASRFADFSEDDLTTSIAFIQAVPLPVAGRGDRATPG